MERNAQEELKAHLMATNEEFRQLASQHSDYARKLDALESLPHLTSRRELEETAAEEAQTSVERSDGSDHEPVPLSTGRLTSGARTTNSFGPVGFGRPGFLGDFRSMLIHDGPRPHSHSHHRRLRSA